MIIRGKYQPVSKAITWLLVVAVSALTILPMHLHLQHVDDASSPLHEHVVDLHFVMDNIDPLQHEDAVVFSVTPDGMLKKIADKHLLAVLFLCLSVLLLISATALKQRPWTSCIHPAQPRFSLSPPLRAPPPF